MPPTDDLPARLRREAADLRALLTQRGIASRAIRLMERAAAEVESLRRRRDALLSVAAWAHGALADDPESDPALVQALDCAVAQAQGDPS